MLNRAEEMRDLPEDERNRLILEAQALNLRPALRERLLQRLKNAAR